MKVLEKGNPNGWEIERVCTGDGFGGGGCGAELVIREKDIGLCKSEKDTYCFSCRECGTITRIPQKRIPSKIIHKIRRK